MDFKNILIVGAGVMGGSYLKTLADYSCNLFVIENDNSTIQKAKKDNSNISFISLDDSEVLKRIDLVILTLYPSRVKDYMIELNNKLNADVLVCEIAGIKQELAQQLEVCNISYNYLLVHPMAGNENGGYDYSKKGIFVNANHIIIDDQMQCGDDLLEKYITFIGELGFNSPIMMSAFEHDKAITYTSQLSHVIASALLNSKDYKDYTRQTIGDSFRDLTRIAKMNVDMWSSLFMDNQDNLVSSIDSLVEQLDAIRNSIANNDKDELIKYLEYSRVKRSEFEHDR